MIPTRVALIRGDTSTITLTMDEGAGLDAADVRFSTRANAGDTTAIWEKVGGSGITVPDETSAVVAITTTDWDMWEAAGCPDTMAYDFEVTAGSTVTTVAGGTITVWWDVTR